MNITVRRGNTKMCKLYLYMYVWKSLVILKVQGL